MINNLLFYGGQMLEPPQKVDTRLESGEEQEKSPEGGKKGKGGGNSMHFIFGCHECHSR